MFSVSSSFLVGFFPSVSFCRVSSVWAVYISGWLLLCYQCRNLVDFYTEQPTTEKTENHGLCTEKDEDIKNNNRTVSREVGHIHESQEKSLKTVENTPNQGKQTLPDLLDLPRSLENVNFAAREEIQDFTTISDTDMKELLNPTNFIINNQVLAKYQKKMTFPVETEETLLDLPSEEAIAATPTEEQNFSLLDYLTDNSII